MNTTFLRSACQFCIKNLGQRQKGTSSHKWMQRQHKDPYVKRAREENWRCRSAFKLLEIDDKHKLFTPGQLVIDIGAAPGSWTQVACRRINASGSGKSKGNGICCFIMNDLYWRPSYRTKISHSHAIIPSHFHHVTNMNACADVYVWPLSIIQL